MRPKLPCASWSQSGHAPGAPGSASVFPIAAIVGFASIGAFLTLHNVGCTLLPYGVVVRGFNSRFIPWADIAEIAGHSRRTELKLVDGSTTRLPLPAERTIEIRTWRSALEGGQP